jgi:hypothetical protein
MNNNFINCRVPLSWFVFQNSKLKESKGQKTEQMVNHSFPHGRTYLIILGEKHQLKIIIYVFGGKNN